MSKSITIIVADDHELYRDGLFMMLRQIKDFNILKEVEDATSLFENIIEEDPDIVLISEKLSEIDGSSIIKELRKLKPEVGIVALSIISDERCITTLIEAGANAFLMKSASKKEIVEAIKIVYGGNHYFCSQTIAKLAADINKNRKQQKLPALSERELKIINFICNEKTNKEIAQELFLSPRTVEALRLNVQEKIKVKSSVGLAIYAIQAGLYQISNR